MQNLTQDILQGWSHALGFPQLDLVWAIGLQCIQVVALDVNVLLTGRRCGL